MRRLEVYGEEAGEGRAGECVAINVVDLPAESLMRGSLLCGSDAVQPVAMVEAEVRLLDLINKPLKDYLEVHLHIGTAETMAHVAVLDDREFKPAQTHLVQLRLQEPLGAAPGDRFVIRTSIPGHADGRVTTIGGGRILGTGNIRLRRNRQWTLELLQARAAALDSPSAWCAQILRESAEPLSLSALARRALLTPAQVKTLLETLCMEGAVVPAGDEQHFLHRALIAETSQRLRDFLSAFHTANPQALGMEEEALLAQLACHRMPFQLALAKLCAQHVVERQGVVMKLCSHRVKLNSEEDRLLLRLESEFRQAALCPPVPAELAGALALRPDRLARLLGLLVNQGVLVKVAPELLMHRDAVAHARLCAVNLFMKSRQFTTMEFRDALGVSRKYAVPLLDYLDIQRVTVRSGNVRTRVWRRRKRWACNRSQCIGG